MKVKQLKNLLNDFDDNMEVIVSRDEEGNGFSPLYVVEQGYYLPDCDYFGDVFCEQDIEDMKKDGEMINNLQDAIILWPKN